MYSALDGYLDLLAIMNTAARTRVESRVKQER